MRTVADLLKALEPRGVVETWVQLTSSGGQPIAHRFRLYKTELIDHLKKVPQDRPARFQVMEWNYTVERSGLPDLHGRSRSVILGTDKMDDIEEKWNETV